MTNAIEVMKREMYKWLLSVKQLADSQASSQAANMLETCLEIYLEELRRESVHQQSRLELNESLANGFSEQVEAANKLINSYREQCDTLRNKLQAFEFANRSAAELLSEALREPSGLRKSVGSMVHQSSDDHCSNAACACSNSSFWPSSETPKPIPMIIRAEFDDRIRTTCTACKRSEDVFK